ncbi:MAG: hypothetical protein QG623_673 [Patescibacteria group bacterium]|nr:hypothetical protein [Patescibacteria group bacterium]
MSRYELPEDFDRAAFESAYYTELASDADLTEAIVLRNDGWELFKAGSKDEGTQRILESRNILLDRVGRPGELYGDLCDTEQIKKLFVRESYASIARLAQALCAEGEFEDAFHNAILAQAHRPYSFIQEVRLSGDDSDEQRQLFAYYDQYRAIFSGRLGLVLSTSSDHASDRQITEEARGLARVSEDPDYVLFANNDMTQAQRDATVKNFTLIARAATVASYAPLPIARAIAQRVCAR